MVVTSVRARWGHVARMSCGMVEDHDQVYIKSMQIYSEMPPSFRAMKESDETGRGMRS